MYKFPKIKESILNKIRKRNRQLARLMVKNPRFQEKIAVARKTLGMPERGFADQKSFNLYYEKKVKEFENKTFDGVKYHEPRYSSKFDAFFRYTNHGVLLMNGLMANMEKFVEYYLCFNELPEEDRYYTWAPYCTDFNDEFSDNPIKLCIVIDDSTTIEEVKAVWPRVMEQQRIRKFMKPINHKKAFDVDNLFDVVDSYKRKSQFKEIKNMERDELIIKLKSEGLSCTAIKKKLIEMGYKGINYEYVSKIIKRYNLRMGIRKA